MNKAGFTETRSRRFAPGKKVVGVVAIAVASTAFMGCPPGTIDVCDPNNYPDGDVPQDICFPDGGGEQADAGADAPIATCAGACVPLAPDGWEFPDLVWMGPEIQAPSCPESAPRLGYEGHADLDAPSICGACSCDPPAGSCALPATMTVSSGACASTDPGATFTAFDPPAGWDGGCTSNDPVPAGQLCGAGPCVQSITIAPLTVSEGGCAPAMLPVPKDATTSWKTFARSCRSATPGTCADSGQGCLPEIPAGFRACVYHEGDVDCSGPALAPYTEKHVFYAGFEDTRACTACTCGDPTGSTCTAELSIHADGACASFPVVAVLADASKATCHDVIAGSALGSKIASEPVYAPGTCAPSGGEPMGAATPIKPSTYCCIPPP